MKSSNYIGQVMVLNSHDLVLGAKSYLDMRDTKNNKYNTSKNTYNNAHLLMCFYDL